MSAGHVELRRLADSCQSALANLDLAARALAALERDAGDPAQVARWRALLDTAELSLAGLQVAAEAEIGALVRTLDPRVRELYGVVE